MKSFIIKTSVVVLSTFIFQCNPTSKESEQSIESEELPAEVKIEQTLYDEIMTVHDEMMPKMDYIMSIKGQLIERADSIRQQTPESTEIEEILSAVKGLEEADEAMMQWMRQFDSKSELPHKEKVKYYALQKEKMDSVKVVMTNAMEKGANLLGKP